MTVVKILMWTFAVIGGIFVIAIVMLFVLRWWLVRKVRRLGADFGEMLKGVMGAVPDVEVKLEPGMPDLLDDVPAAREAIDRLKARGFVDAGRYKLEALKARIAGLANAQVGAYASVMEVPERGVMIDVVAPYADGTYVTYTTTPEQGVARPPGKPMVRLVGASADEVLDRFVAERPTGALKPVSAGQFKAEVEQYSREEMMWRMARGFASDEEVESAMDRDQELAGVDPFARKQVKMLAMRLMQGQAHEKAVESLRQQFLEQGGMSAAQWEEVREETVFIYDGMPADMVVSYVGELAPDSEDEDEGEGEEDSDEFVGRVEQRVKAVGARVAFSEFNQQLPAGRQYERLGEVRGVVPADVYREPEGRDDEDDDEDEEEDE